MQQKYYTQQDLDQRNFLTVLTGLILDVIVFLWALQRNENYLYTACIVFFFIFFTLCLQYYMFATHGRPVPMLLEDDNEIEFQHAPPAQVKSVQPVATATVASQSATSTQIVPARNPQNYIRKDLTTEDLRFMNGLMAFVAGVIEGHTNRSYWQSKGWTASNYQDYIGLLKLPEIGVVQSGGQGAAQVVLVDDENEIWRRLNLFFGYNIPDSLDAARIIRSQGKVIQSGASEPVASVVNPSPIAVAEG